MRRPGAAGRGGRPVRYLLAASVGLLVGVGAYFGYGALTAPSPLDAPGWTRLADMPVPRGETAAAVIGSRLFVIGGLTGPAFEATTEVSVFDAASGTWTAGPPLPQPRHHAAAASIGGDVYVSGGANAAGEQTADVWVLRDGADRWEAVASLPWYRVGHRMVALDGRLYTVGGLPSPAFEDELPVEDSVLQYDPVQNAWAIGRAQEEPRDHVSAVVVDGEIWLLGGRGPGGNHALVDIYDPAAHAWRDGPPIPEATSGAAEGVVDGWILVSGGEDPVRGAIIDGHWALDTAAANPQWVPLAHPPLTVHGAPGAVVDGRFLIAGGSARAGGQSNTAWSALTQGLLALP